MSTEILSKESALTGEKAPTPETETSATTSIREIANEPKIPDVLPILPIRNTVVFPGTVVPVTVQRPASLKLLEENLQKSKIIGVIAQRAAEKDDPGLDDLYDMGTAVQVLKLLRQADNSILVVIKPSLIFLPKSKPFTPTHLPITTANGRRP